MITECGSSNLIKRKCVEKDGVTYTYELQSFEGKNVASFGIVLYEIIVKSTIDEKNSFYRTGGLFSNKEKALEFLRFLINSTVTPRNLPYVIEDSFSF